eukprot:m.39678 g.39678  ORF g.39678 m.39678 type:complete len:881 (-) comp9581_c0_seq2:341-2983(-)
MFHHNGNKIVKELLVLLAFFVGYCKAGNTIYWASQPTFPNETVVLHGDFSPAVTTVEIATGTGLKTTVTALYVNTSAAAFVIPPTFPVGVYSISFGGANTVVNTPELWWIQGDQGESSSPGGWIRVFGKAIFFDHGINAEIIQRKRDIRDAAKDNQIDRLSGLLTSLQSLQEQQKSLTPPVLRLSSPGQENITINGMVTNGSLWDGTFEVPKTVLSGLTWSVYVNNGLPGGEFVPLSSFVSPLRPKVTGIKIQTPTVKELPVFDVTKYNLTFNDTYYSGAPYARGTSTGTHWDIPLQRALSAARKAGGGIVYFPRGSYYLVGAVRVPNNVILRGAGAQLTSLHFKEVFNMSALPTCFDNPALPPRYFCSDVPGDNHTSADTEFVTWGLEDFTFYVTAFHSTVIEVHNKTDGFRMTGVRGRVNAFFMQSPAGYKGEGHENNAYNGTSTPRLPDFMAWSGAGPGDSLGELLLLHGKNWVISDNDLMSDETVINSFNWDANKQRHGATFGILQRNKLWNGSGGCKPMDAWQQVISEDNICHGTSLLSGGNALGSSEGGFSQHYFASRNIMSWEWGEDREIITFDDAGGSYLGPIIADGVNITTKFNTKCSNSDRQPFGWEGGSMAVLNGTGAGQIRRIVKSPIFDVPTPNNRTGWVIDRPFDVTPSADAFVQIYTFRGEVIWHCNEWEDVGTFQTYGTSTNVVFSSNKWTRGSKIVIEGQWRSWVPGDAERLTGPFGIGANPTFRSLVINNTVAEANSAALYYDGLWRQGVFSLASGLGESGGKWGLKISPVLSWGTIFKTNTVLSNGGISIGWGTHSAVCEGNRVFNSDFGIHIAAPNRITPVVVRNNHADIIVFDKCNITTNNGNERYTGQCHGSPNIGPG